MLDWALCLSMVGSECIDGVGLADEYEGGEGSERVTWTDGVELEGSRARNPEAGVEASLSFLSKGLAASGWSSSRFMMDCRLDMVAVVRGG